MVHEVEGLIITKDFDELTVACGGVVVFTCDAKLCRLLAGSTLDVMKFLRHLPLGDIELTYTSDIDLRLDLRRRLWIRPASVGRDVMAFNFLQLNAAHIGQGPSGRLELHHVGHGLILSVSRPMAAMTLQVDDVTLRVPAEHCCNQAAPVLLRAGYYIPLAGKINFSRHDRISFVLELTEQTEDVLWHVWYVNENFLQLGAAGQLAPCFAN